MSKQVLETTTTVFDDTQVAPEVFLPAVQKTPDLPVTSASAAREFLNNAIDSLIAEAEHSALNEAEADLAANPLTGLVRAIWDAFQNSEGAPIHIYNTNNKTAVEAVSEIVELTGKEVNQIALAVHMNPVASTSNPEALPFHPTDPLAELIEKYAQRGIAVNVLSLIKNESYEDMIKWLDKKEYAVLSDKSGKDAISIVAGSVYHQEFDLNCKVPHSPLGAMLGKQIFLDLYCGVGEPMAGLRPDDVCDAKGGLNNLAIAPQPGKMTPFDYDQRKALSKRGIITLYSYNGVPCVVGGNRSLEDGKGIYIFRSTTRLRQTVASAFHKTAEIHGLFAGKREAGPLEKAAKEMNKFLAELKNEGWLIGGNAAVDYQSMKVKLKVYFEPVPPIDEIEIEFSDKPFEDEI